MNLINWILFGCAVIGAVVGILSYRSSVTVKETRKMTLEKFDFLKRINSQLLIDLFDYGNRTKSFHESFMQRFTLQQSIDLLERINTEVLNNDYRSTLIRTKSKMRLEEIMKHLDTQIQHHSEVRTQFDYFINKSK